VALTGGAAREEHGGSRGGRRAKCDEEKAKVKFAMMMEAAQGILTVRKLWVGCMWVRRWAAASRRPWARPWFVGGDVVWRDTGHAGDFPQRALAKRPQAGFIASVGCTVRVGRAHNKFY
jgi:hypothetical protein